MKRILAALCLFLLAVSASYAAESNAMNNLAWYRLHLGMGTGEHALSPHVVREFSAKEIASRFPSGFTVTPTIGLWTPPGGNGLVNEKATIIDVYCPDTPENNEKINQIGNTYVERFKKSKRSVYILRIPSVDATFWH